MNDNLDKWLEDSKVETPDSGEFRRLNRLLIKERIIASGPARRRRHRILVIVISLLLLMLLSGNVSQLGSDSFEMKKTTEFRPWRDGPVTVYENVFRGGSVNLPDEFSAADIDEFQRSVAAGEGTIIEATGLSYGGKTLWLKHVSRNINGRENLEGSTPENPPSQEPDDFIEFLTTNQADLISRTKTSPPQAKFKMVVDGVKMDFDSWTFEYPGYGKVTRYVGFPVEKN